MDNVSKRKYGSKTASIFLLHIPWKLFLGNLSEIDSYSKLEERRDTMPYELFPENFWRNFFLSLFLLIAGSFLLVWLFNAVMRRWLEVRKLRFFGTHYVNDTHKKWDWRLRIGYLVLFVVAYFFVTGQGMYFEWFVLLLIPLYFGQVILQAYMEWKHGKGRVQAVYTVVEFGFLLSVVLILASFLIPDFQL